jgi:hypothetical protein
VTLFEVCVAAALLTVFVGSAGHVVGAFAVGERTVERRALAQRAVDNLIEELLSATPEQFESLLATAAENSPEQLAAEKLSESVRERLPGSRLSYRVESEAEPLPARRVTLRLDWTTPRGQTARPVRLTGWVFFPERTEP